jgi:hypothetical protein
MKKTVKALIECAAVLCGVLLIIHRRVIAACITVGQMPEMPEWHKTLFKCPKKEEEK